MLQALLHGLICQSAGGEAAGLYQFFPLIAVFVIMYFLLIRPQQKQAGEHKTLLAGLKKGDEVVTSGGVVGKIYAVTDKLVTLEIANGVRIRVVKSFVQSKQTTVEAADEAAEKKEPAEEKKEGK